MAAPLTASAPSGMGKACQTLHGSDPRRSVDISPNRNIRKSSKVSILTSSANKDRGSWTRLKYCQVMSTPKFAGVKLVKTAQTATRCRCASFWERFELPSPDHTSSAQTFYNCLNHAQGAQRDSQRQRQAPWRRNCTSSTRQQCRVHGEETIQNSNARAAAFSPNHLHLMSFIKVACLTIYCDILISCRFSKEQCDAMCLNETANAPL